MRFVFADGALVLDKEQNMGGRGAYVHPDKACISAATQSRNWERLLRLKAGELTDRVILDSLL